MLNTIKVSGPDAKAFLDAQSTIKTDKNESAYCAFLSPKSEIKGLVFLIKVSSLEFFLILKNTERAENLKNHLEKFIILEELELDLVS